MLFMPVYVPKQKSWYFLNTNIQNRKNVNSETIKHILVKE